MARVTFTDDHLLVRTQAAGVDRHDLVGLRASISAVADAVSRSTAPRLPKKAAVDTGSPSSDRAADWRHRRTRSSTSRPAAAVGPNANQRPTAPHGAVVGDTNT